MLSKRERGVVTPKAPQNRPRPARLQEPEAPVAMAAPRTRAERRAMRHESPTYRQARKASRALRRAGFGWAGAFRPGHGSQS